MLKKRSLSKRSLQRDHIVGSLLRTCNSTGQMNRRTLECQVAERESRCSTLPKFQYNAATIAQHTDSKRKKLQTKPTKGGYKQALLRNSKPLLCNRKHIQNAGTRLVLCLTHRYVSAIIWNSTHNLVSKILHTTTACVIIVISSQARRCFFATCYSGRFAPDVRGEVEICERKNDTTRQCAETRKPLMVRGFINSSVRCFSRAHALSAIERSIPMVYTESNLIPKESSPEPNQVLKDPVLRKIAMVCLSPGLVAAIVCGASATVICTMSGIIAALAGVDVARIIKQTFGGK